MRCPVKEPLSGQTAVTLKGSLKTVSCTEMVYIPGRMVEDMKETTVLTKSMARARIHTQMVASTVANGLMVFNMASEASSTRTVPTRGKVFGQTAS